MMKGSRHLFVLVVAGGGLVLSLVVLLGLGVSVVKHQSLPSTQASGTQFHAVVVDQDGRPVADAKFQARATRMRPNPIIAGGMLPSTDDARVVTAISDDQGRVTIALAEKENVLDNCEVQKEGYGDVVDWAWTSGGAYARGQNRSYRLASYRPDPARPARYVLHRLDLPERPPESPSRGGWDREPNGAYRGNEPLQPLIPSFGKGSPLGNDEVNRRIVELRPDNDPRSPRYQDSRSTTRTVP